MTALDWILLALWIGITLSGFWKGAVRVVFGIGGALAGVWLAVAVGDEAAAALEPALGVSWLAEVLGRMLPAIACVGISLLAAWGIERTLHAMHLRWLNRVCGAALAGAAAMLLLAVMLVTTVRLSPTFSGWCADSLLAPRFVEVLDWALTPQETDAGTTSSATASGDDDSGR